MSIRNLITAQSAIDALNQSLQQPGDLVPAEDGKQPTEQVRSVKASAIAPGVWELIVDYWPLGEDVI